MIFCIIVLAFYKAKETININISRALATLYYQQGNPYAAYVWAAITTTQQPNNINKSTAPVIKNPFNLTKYERLRLDTIALNIITALKKGKYTRTEINAQH